MSNRIRNHERDGAAPDAGQDFCRGIMETLLRGVPLAPVFPGSQIDRTTGDRHASTQVAGARIRARPGHRARPDLGASLMCIAGHEPCEAGQPPPPEGPRH